MGKKIMFICFAVISLILIDVFSRFLYDQSWFGSTTLANEVDPFDIINLIVTLIATIWLGWYVSKKLTEKRFEKEYIITDLKQIEEEISYIEKNVESSRLELDTVLNMLNKLSAHIERFSKTIQIFKISAINVIKLKKNYQELYEKTTNVEGNFLQIDTENRNEINQICTDFVITAREMIYTINKH